MKKIFLFLLFLPPVVFSQNTDSFSGYRCSLTTNSFYQYGDTPETAQIGVCEFNLYVSDPDHDFVCRTGFNDAGVGLGSFPIGCSATEVCVTEDGFDKPDSAGFCPDLQPSLDCPASGTSYGALGNVCTKSGLVGDIFTPITAFVAANPNNPDRVVGEPEFCVVARIPESVNWSYTGGEGSDTNLVSTAESCPPDVADPDDPTSEDDDLLPDVPPPDDPDDPEDPNDPNEPVQDEPSVGGSDDPNYPNDPNEPNEPNEPEPYVESPVVNPSDYDLSLSGDCSAPPTCSGNADQCGVIYQIYESSCSSDAKAVANTEDLIDVIVDRTDRGEDEKRSNTALDVIKEQREGVQKLLDELGSAVSDSDDSLLEGVESLGESDADTIDGTDIEQPDWLDGVLPAGGGCQTISYSVAGYSGNFPTVDGCEKFATFRIIMGWALYLYLIHVAFRTFVKVRPS